MKPKRGHNKEYLKFVRSLPCTICQAQWLSEPHHIAKDGHGGMGTKCLDERTIPLCFTHHRQAHDMGKKTFREKYDLDIEYIIGRLNGIYDNMP